MTTEQSKLVWSVLSTVFGGAPSVNLMDDGVIMITDDYGGVKNAVDYRIRITGGGDNGLPREFLLVRGTDDIRQSTRFNTVVKTLVLDIARRRYESVIKKKV